MLDTLIIGGGISGLTVAHAAGMGKRPGKCELWEACDRVGGTIGTDRVEGYSVDWGPNGFLDREPLTLKLVDELGLREALEPANPLSEKRFIAKNGRLHPVPFSPAKMVKTALLGPLGKARVFCEPLVPGRRGDGDESVFDFAARRIGRAAAETFVDPMVSGVFGGVARELSLPSCFPIMREMETRYGGLVKAMIARGFEKRRAGAPKKKGGPAGPAGRLTSLQTGLDLLIQRLEQELAPVIRKGRRIARITRNDDFWEVADDSGTVVQAGKLVIACPTYAAAGMLQDFDSELADAFEAIPYAPIIVVATGHRREDVTHPLDGFGFLVPRTQGMRTLGSIWTSSIFAARAPEGYVQFRSMLGGAGDPAVLELSDDQLWETLRRELDPLIGIRNDPTFIRIYRWEKGIPQFKLGHRERRARLERLVARHPGLFITGNAYYGVGLNDCVKMARRVASQLDSRN
ncbi:MAG: protoporphyrinogen oxidase [Acidobacteria bacterium]|nr:protoporphyrinogen oxidase [Acidobacteriota bacterium]